MVQNDTKVEVLNFGVVIFRVKRYLVILDFMTSKTEIPKSFYI